MAADDTPPVAPSPDAALAEIRRAADELAAHHPAMMANMGHPDRCARLRRITPAFDGLLAALGTAAVIPEPAAPVLGSIAAGLKALQLALRGVCPHDPPSA